MEKICKKAKWLSGEALQIAVKRREAKSQGEKERCKHLNAEFQRIARRDNKAFFSKEIEENNRMGKTRDFFKKIRDTKGTFCCFLLFLCIDHRGRLSFLSLLFFGTLQSNISCLFSFNFCFSSSFFYFIFFNFIFLLYNTVLVLLYQLLYPYKNLWMIPR